MTENTQTQEEPKSNSKEYNFRALEQKYQRELDVERKKIADMEARLKEKEIPKEIDDEDEDDEPYVDKKRLTKTLAKFGEHTQQQTKTEIERAVEKALNEEKKNSWLDKNHDFYEVMQHADKLAEQDPDFAKAVLKQPETFERQKIVYKHIKALGLDKPVPTEPSIQDKINANRRSPYYQPSSMGNAPYSTQGDFSEAGQKNAYAKMKELQKNMRLG